MKRTEKSVVEPGLHTKHRTNMIFSFLFGLKFKPKAIKTRAGPLLGAERAGPGGGCLNTPPRLTRLMGHVATRGKRHSKERQKS